jgi:dTDP-4-dehydrorhamnose reductase
MSRSPDCQHNPAAAQLANTQVTRHLANLAHNIPFFFFSTDLVFDGQQGQYAEPHPTNPLLVYGQTKANAEHHVLSNPNHTVIRTSLSAGSSPSGKSSFSENLILAWKNGRTPKLFTDEFRTPIDASVTARATWELVLQQATGIFHLAGSERLSRLDIGQIIANTQPHLHCPIQPASIHDFTGSPRPADTSLNCSKIQQLLSFPLPSFRQWQP